ncbi:hypothetical protein TrRE_jg9839 [Triparma retinervis]|uniref:signal-recognition-particle GTPase n=1 Tax=Triparma retinervis TaxID=2557542 RepID=A0A9W7A3L0_9STRA|nr:hypothetical protein TrRE_jg9839 [Triparma retinervis]
MVLAELGASLRESLRKLNSGVSVSEEQVQEVLNEISRALIEADVSVKLVQEMKNKIKMTLATAGDNSNMNKKKLVLKAVQDELVSLLSPSTKPYQMSRKKPNVLLFVGLQGAGKTTTIAKFGGHYARKGWKVAMVCCDSFRAGAFDQLKQNATKLRIPFYGSYTEADPVLIAKKGVEQFRREKYEIVLIDTSGRHKQEAGLFEEMQEISAAVRPNSTVFVMDGTQGQAVYDQALGFHSAVDVGSVIVTKLDGHAKGGGALSAVAATGAPIGFLGTGEHFDDIEPFKARTFVNKLLGYGDVRGYAEEMKEARNSEGSKELAANMRKGKFTLRNFFTTMENMNKMGGLGRMMGGMGMGGMGGAGATQDAKKFKFMMDAMKDEELDGLVEFSLRTPERNKREEKAAGGGMGMPGMGMPGMGMPGMGMPGMGNMADMMQGLSGLGGMPQMGGAGMPSEEQIKAMMKNPQMAEMMKSMGGGVD